MWLTLILTSLTLWASDPSLQAIEQAQSLALKKNRAEATARLQEAIKASGKDSKARAKLLAALDQISTVFFTDKGQKAYESGQSALFENPEMALAQFNQALALEDGNLKILVSMAQVQIFKQDCEAARADLQKAQAINPYSSTVAVLELRNLSCMQNLTALREQAKSLPALDKWESSFVQYLLAQDLLQQKRAKKAQEMLTKVSEEFPRFPETYYLLAQAGQELGRDSEQWQKKYVSLCKGITGRDRKIYALEPRLCVHKKEVEDELAKNVPDL